MNVKKRDGTIVPWDPQKVMDAAQKAGAAEPLADLAEEVRSRLPDTEAVTVEEISDCVEQALMESGQHDVAKAFILYRDQRRRLRELPDPVAGELSKYIAAAKYARENEQGFYETFPEVVDRYLSTFDITDDEYAKAREAMLSLRVLGSMRGLQFGGAAVHAVNERLYNCSYTHINRWHAPAQALFLLLAGCGVGFSVQRCHVDLIGPSKAPNRKKVRHHVVEDTIRGWALAMWDLLDSYFGHGEYVEFSYQRIRLEGSPLKTSGGLAPGHLPLRDMLEDIRKMIPIGRRLRPFEWHCIMCRMADAVLSGGIRRSSLLSLFSADDDEMWTCKTGDWWKDRPWLSNANNSVHYVRGEKPDFQRLIKCAMEFGEPGFFIAESRNHGCNPCAEIGFELRVDADDFGFCNLSEICVPRCKTKEEFIEACKMAAFLGTLQASKTNFSPMFIDGTNARCDALLGISLTGICDVDEIPDDWMTEGKQAARDMNREMANRLGIQTARSIFTVKPSGTASLLLECSAGIHEPHAEYYFRRVTANPNEPLAKLFMEQNPLAVEHKPNGDIALVFPVKGRKRRMNGIQHLELIKRIYQKWVYHPGVCHNVSATVTLDDPAAIEAWLENNHLSVRAISFISPVGDKTYPFAPQEAVSTDADMMRWRDIVANWKPIDYSKVEHVASRTQPEAACFGGACEIA